MNDSTTSHETRPRELLAALGVEPGALSGVRVIEAGQLIAGPFAGQLMADLGAEVIKIEDPQRGDPMRSWGRELPEGHSLWWAVVARNKHSVTLNLRDPEGQRIAHQLIDTADVLIENFRPGTLERWGLGYDILSASNPGLVVARVSGFGQSGPYSSRAGYGAIGEAMGGLRYITGDPSTPPSRTGISIGDSLAAIFATIGTLAALLERGRSGLGQLVDSSIYEAVLALSESLVSEFDVSGYIRERSGSILPNVAPSNVYKAKDGIWLLIAANQDSVFERLCVAMRRPDLSVDERYVSHVARGRHQAELDDLIAAWAAHYDSIELEKTLSDHGVPTGRIYRAPEMLADPHFQQRESIVRIEHPSLGPIAMQNVAPRLSRTPGRVRTVGPALGEHTDIVLRDILGYDAERVQSLRDSGIV